MTVNPADTRECDGYPALASMATIEGVSEVTVRMGVVLGLMRRADDGVHEFTDKGAAYFRRWLAERVPCACGDPADCQECS